MTTTLNEMIPVWRDLHAKASDLGRMPFDPNEPYEPLEKGERELYDALTAALTQQANDHRSIETVPFARQGIEILNSWKSLPDSTGHYYWDDPTTGEKGIVYVAQDINTGNLMTDHPITKRPMSVVQLGGRWQKYAF